MIHDFSIKKLVNDSKLITQKPKVPELIIKAPVHVIPAIAPIKIEEIPQKIEKIIHRLRSLLLMTKFSDNELEFLSNSCKRDS